MKAVNRGVANARDWKPEENLPLAVDALRAARTVLITMHRGPYGDALGSALALASALRDLGREVTVYNPDDLPYNFRFLRGAAEVAENDIWQRAVIGIAAVSNDRSFVNEVLDKCARDAGNIAEILNREMEIETYSEMKSDWSGKPDFDAHDLSRLPPEQDEEELPEQRQPGWLKEEDLE